ncbi:putative heat shock factor-binding protein [Golovinomyces cichoracearum]|uniref:Putative heat shock factor-binding protein n=1 Tax=Golovinomyces cichoracearum TaxID=62708 RepID=A0A420IE92_9PEZI|nr:putative heat shock factor-binding protein [Golovinomyces cichoracearum]RKF82830.1 putative heat shock factor-binding protein [Golovinomyces cichoracearum]
MPLDELSNTSKEIKRPSNNNASAPTELSAVVEDLLNTLSNKFAGVSSEIFAKMDEMSRRLDNLEDSLKNNQLPENESPK